MLVKRFLSVVNIELVIEAYIISEWRGNSVWFQTKGFRQRAGGNENVKNNFLDYTKKYVALKVNTTTIQTSRVVLIGCKKKNQTSRENVVRFNTNDWNIANAIFSRRLLLWSEKSVFIIFTGVSDNKTMSSRNNRTRTPIIMPASYSSFRRRESAFMVNGLQWGLVREISTDEIETSSGLAFNNADGRRTGEESGEEKNKKLWVFPISACVHTEIGREANLTAGTCPEQCHISINYGFRISVCRYMKITR